MDVISPTFGFQDLLPGVIVFSVILLAAIAIGFLFAIEDKRVGSFFSTFLVGLIAAILVSLFVMTLHGPTHHDNMVADLEERFEDGYNLTIVDNSPYADIPLTPGDKAEAVKVFLHEIPGEQSIIVEIVGDKYVVTHNGEVREVQND